MKFAEFPKKIEELVVAPISKVKAETTACSLLYQKKPSSLLPVFPNPFHH